MSLTGNTTNTLNLSGITTTDNFDDGAGATISNGDLTINNINLAYNLIVKVLTIPYTITPQIFKYISTLTGDIMGLLALKRDLTNVAFSSIPTCEVVPTTQYELVNKAYADINGNLLASSNTWTNNNKYNTPPTCEVTPTTQFQLVNKTYVDVAKKWILTAPYNIYTGLNSFTNPTGVCAEFLSDANFLAVVYCSNDFHVALNTVLNLCSITSATIDTANIGTANISTVGTAPTVISTDSSTNIATTAFVTTAISGITSLLGLANTWTGTNAFSNTLTGATVNITTGNITTGNITTGNITTGNIPTLNSTGTSTLAIANITTGNITTGNITTGNIPTLNSTGTSTLATVNIGTSGTAPTMISTSNSTNVATTAFVKTAISGITSLLGLANTWTGTNTFYSVLLNQTYPNTTVNNQLGYKAFNTTTGSASMTFASVGTISLPIAGVWLVEANLSITTPSGWIATSINTSSATQNLYCNQTVQVSGGGYSQHLITTFSVSGISTAYFTVQLSSSSATTTCYMSATRIG